MNDSSTESQVELFDFQKERGVYDSIISDWTTEKNACETRRKLRENRVNVEEERQAKRILEDETKIPDRTINTNIKRAKGPYVNYIVGAKKSLILSDVYAPDYDTEPLELWFTRGMHYPGWKNPWMKLIDAFLTHGGCAVEVVYDPDMPFHVSVEYIPRDCLLFPQKTKNLQACPRVLRKYHITVLELEELAKKYDFNPTIVEKIIAKFTKRTDMLDIYRALSKKDSIVYSTWYSPDEQSDWLREPIEHQVGLFDFDPVEIQNVKSTQDWNIIPQMDQSTSISASVDGNMEPPQPQQSIREQMLVSKYLSKYPLYWFKMDETENEELLKEQGRVALDLHVQEALTSLLSSTVNASYRASNLYPTAENMPGDDTKLGELGPIKPGVISSRKLVINQFPWPQAIILTVMQAMGVRNAQDSGNTDFAAMARPDANKTKYELEMSSSQSNEVASLDLTVFSTPYLDVMALCFLIAQHQAIFELIPTPTDPECLYHSYNMQPAGDIEVIKRLEDRENAKAFFELVRGTPMADKLMQFLFEHFFPDQADDWITVMNQSQETGQLASMIMQLVNVLKEIPTNELSESQRAGLNNLINAASDMAQQSADAAVTPNTPTTAIGNSQQSQPYQPA